jgi:hypothetical protein
MRAWTQTARLVSVASLALGLLMTDGRPAAASYVGRSLVLPSSRLELALGAGLGRVPDHLGLGFNLELGIGLGSALELRGRTGLRVGNNGRFTRADVYGRPFQTETYNTGGDTVANPELGLIWAFARGRPAEIGLDMRVTLPVGSDIGVMVALPIRLHLGRARLDTGVYVPIFFHDRDGDRDDDVDAIISVPFHLFFQPSGDFYLGFMTGVRFHDPGTTVPLGFGLGSAVSYGTDLRFWLLFPDVSHDGSAKVFGLGVGLNVLF